MDFPKGCSSNVHVVENLAQTRFILYSWKDDQVGAQEQRRHTQEAIASLREQNALCASEEGGLWVFGDLADDQKEYLKRLHDALVLEEEGKIEDNAAKQIGGGKLVRDVLLDAVEGAVAFHLAKDRSTVHVAPWIWLCCGSEDTEGLEVESTAMKLHTRFAPNGALYLVPQFVSSRWLSADLTPATAGTEALMAPYGRPVRVVSDDTEAKTTVAGDTWRSQVEQAMRPEGISIDNDEPWQIVHFADEAPVDAFEWPLRLLFICANTHQWVLPTLGNHDWRSWFAGASISQSFRNPLAAAEEWFLGAGARERAAQQPDQTNSSTNGGEWSNGSTATGFPQNGSESTLVTSPVFNQRHLEQQAAMAGIYPTPPDGLTQSQPMPNLNAMATPSATQAEQGPTGGDLLPTSDDSQLKGVDFNMSAEPETYQMGQEDLFGDVGEMEFGDHEVGDADFSFFDEPDEEPVAPPLEDTEMVEAPVGEADKPVERVATVEAQDTEPHTMDRKMTDGGEEPVEASKSPKTIELLQENENSYAADDRPSAPQFVQPEKPLSPFGIRERLLPPPVPASVAQNNTHAAGDQRRNSTFGPIAFREGLHLESKYADANVPADDVRLGRSQQPKEPDISLPPMRKKSRLPKQDEESDEDSDSEDDSFESESSESEQELPPQLPWDNRKRKRHIDQNSANFIPWMDMPELAESGSGNEFSLGRMAKILEKSLTIQQGLNLSILRRDEFKGRAHAQGGLSGLPDPESRTYPIPHIEDMYDLRKDDLICIAQVVGEASITAFETTAHGMFANTSRPTTPTPAILSRPEALLRKTLLRMLPGSELCDLANVALTREPPPRPGTNPGKAPQGQPRPPQRSESMMLGPDYFSVPAPYIRIRRGADNWEMLPTSLCFWETLGLGPANGPKNVRAFCLFPLNEDLQHLVEQFITELGTSFESCKLGSHVHMRNAVEKNESDTYEDGMAPVELGNDVTFEGALKAYATASADLGKALSSISHDESDRTIVVYMVNPFEEASAIQHLCACFWLLFKAYRDNLPKARRNQCGSDVVLQLLPIDAIASFDALVVPDAKQMAMLACEVYDRCPPSNSSQLAENMSPLPILVAPAVELASSAPKRIGFQLIAEPPGDLLHEGSVLHLAYAMSPDGQWLTAAWIDSTGQHQSTISFCLRGRSFADVAEDVWERTREIIAARQVTWRIFILTSENVDSATSQCWRALSSKPRLQPLCVTMLSAQIDPALQLFPPAVASEQSFGKDGQDAGFLTPASTPQGNNFTSSPDVSGHANAPLTPAPSETAASIAENDPDAHLTDITDETWGVLLSPKLTHLASNTGLANGILFKRGDVEATQIGSAAATGEKLPSLGVNLHWTIQVKPSGGVDEGSIRQAELTLRELLKLYRNLALLTKAKGLDHWDAGMVPLHVAMAMRGAKGLDGMLAPVVG